MDTINAIWIGPILGSVHAACLRSFLRHGHEVVLHTFEAPQDLPAGVKLFDAERLMKRAEIFRHRKTGSFALASDIYRYRILKEGMGAYVDCDIFCLRPFEHQDYILGWETDEVVNGAVLKAPHDSQLLDALREASENPFFIPPWVSRARRRLLQTRRLLGVPQHVASMKWGVLGPSLLTHCVKKLGLSDKVMPIDAFYALHFGQTPLLIEKGLSVADIVTPRSYAIHLANSKLNRVAPPKGSPMHEILAC